MHQGAVSYFYSILLRHEVVDEAKIKQAREIELGLEIDSDSWEEGLENIHTCSINVRHNLIQFKTLHRLYLSKVKLHSIFPEVSPFCNRCKVAEGSLTHYGCALNYRNMRKTYLIVFLKHSKRISNHVHF